jgi:nucleoid-associated protein YgaU
VLFAWGSLTFTGVLVRANERFTMFLESGIPVRAQVQVSFHERVPAEEEAREVKRQTADFTHRHVVGQGQTLSGIASAVYGDPTKWRPIAIANDLDDPRRLPPGLVLDVPRLPFRDPQTGRIHA